MKKFLAAILAFLYISTSTGAFVQMHYCMGKLADSGFGHHKTNICDQCGMEKPGEKNNDCCKDESKFFKSQTDQEVTVSVFHLMQPATVVLPVSFFEMPYVDISIIPAENPSSHAPPKDSGVAVYIRNCVFRI
ncbi:MAG: hypothetical protein ABIN01_02400 [Ferruginibacter sp.]